MHPPPTLAIFYQLTATVLDKGYQAAFCEPLKILPLFSSAGKKRCSGIITYKWELSKTSLLLVTFLLAFEVLGPFSLLNFRGFSNFADGEGGFITPFH